MTASVVDRESWRLAEGRRPGRPVQVYGRTDNFIINLKIDFSLNFFISGFTVERILRGMLARSPLRSAKACFRPVPLCFLLCSRSHASLTFATRSTSGFKLVAHDAY